MCLWEARAPDRNSAAAARARRWPEDPAFATSFGTTPLSTSASHTA